MRIVVFILLATLFLGCIVPSSKHVCPDGNIVDFQWTCKEYSPERITANPENYKSVFLQDNKSTYIKVGGEITTSIVIRPGEEVSMLGDFIDPEDPKEGHAKLEIINKSGDRYLVRFFAPEVPGEFDIRISKRIGSESENLIGQYNLTVIGPVENETMAYSVADYLLSRKIAGSQWGYDLRNGSSGMWRFISSGATEADTETWDVFLRYGHEVCNDGMLSMSIDCKETIITTELAIDKKTGQIVG